MTPWETSFNSSERTRAGPSHLCVHPRRYPGAHHGFIGDSVLACQLQCSISIGNHAVTEALQTFKRVLGLPVPRTSMQVDTRPTDWTADM